MKNKIFHIAVIAAFAVLTASQPTKAYADLLSSDVKIAGNSGTIVPVLKAKQDDRAKKLRNYLLKYNSPLAPYANDFVAYADKYNIDYRLVPAISGVESTFGNAIPFNSYNAYGWAGGSYAFANWEDGIAVVSQTLRTNYMDKWGATSVDEIAPIYAPPSTTWAFKVKYFMNQIEKEDATQNNLLALGLSL